MALAALACVLCARAAEGEGLNFKVDEAEFEACETCLNGEQQCKWCTMWTSDIAGLDAGGACQCRQGRLGDCHFRLSFSEEVTDKAACRTFLPETQREPTCTTCPEGCILCRTVQGTEFCDCTGKCAGSRGIYLDVQSQECDASFFADPSSMGLILGLSGLAMGVIVSGIGYYCKYVQRNGAGIGPPSSIPVWDVSPTPQPTAMGPAAVPVATAMPTNDSPDSKSGVRY